MIQLRTQSQISNKFSQQHIKCSEINIYSIIIDLFVSMPWYLNLTPSSGKQIMKKVFSQEPIQRISNVDISLLEIPDKESDWNSEILISSMEEPSEYLFI